MRKTADKIKGFLQRRPQAFITDEAYQMASLKYAPDMADVIWEVKRAFEKGVEPETTDHGSAATYFLKDSEDIPIAVFKVYHALHEYAAYRLDHARFAGVPQTVLTTLDHPILGGKKTGSCQLFIPNTMAAVELKTYAFDRLSSSSIRRIGALDIRMLNEDRHSSNLLVLDLKEAIPIDHGFILPHDLSRIHFVWMGWSQSKTPFSPSEKSYIDHLNPEEDRRILIDELCIEELLANRHYVAALFLKKGVAHGFTPHALGSLMICSPRASKMCSPFELLIEQIKEKNAPNWAQFSQIVEDEVEKILTKMSYEKISQ